MLSQKIGKQNNLKVLGSKKTKGPKHGNLCLREIALIILNFIFSMNIGNNYIRLLF